MKKIEAIIRKSKFDEVVNALHDAEVYFFSYWGCYRSWKCKNWKCLQGNYIRHKRYSKKMLSIIVSDSFVDATVDAILKSGATGNVGDGKIFIYPCEEAYRIRTGEKGNKSFN
jgi:nitrogen regulatory protein P-II 1